MPLGINPPDEVQDILKELNRWAAGEAGLFMSLEAVEAYWNLREVMGKRPGNGDSYLEQQIENIWNAIISFRSAIRRDIGVMHYADKQKLP